MSRSTEEGSAGNSPESDQGIAKKPADPVEIELDTKELRSLPAPAKRSGFKGLREETATQRELTDTATNLELSQSLDDLRNLSWPLIETERTK